jgi:catechol 2,3-dioxygenase
MSVTPPTSIDPATSMGRVRLTAADSDQARSFYERVIGLRTLAEDGDTVTLGAEGGPAVVELVSNPDAPPRPPGTSGLFHLAILVPTRVDLARALRRVADAGWRFTGASDHLVSEALYLNDPEGNGIEIYRDRPRDQWGHTNGEVRMATIPLDLGAVLAEAGDEAANGVPAGTTMGHVHLRVADIPAAEGFYNGALGLEVMVRSYPGALFLSAGGYHHHLGVNTWQSQGAPPPPEGSLGLDRYELVLPTVDERDAAAGEVGELGDPIHTDDGVLATDPSGNHVLLTSREA